MNPFPMSEVIEKSCIDYATRFLYGDIKTEVLKIIETPEHGKREQVLYYLTAINKAECNLINLINE